MLCKHQDIFPHHIATTSIPHLFAILPLRYTRSAIEPVLRLVQAPGKTIFNLHHVYSLLSLAL
jgi:hypothetical protein